MQTIASLLKQAIAQLKSLDSARLDAELLLAFVLAKPRAYLLAYPDQEVAKQQQAQFQTLLQQRLQKIPLAYLLGEKEFWSLPFKVGKDVLVPRPETELLVETILTDYSAAKELTLIDLGTGSGAIAIALAYEKSDWKIFASDFSEKALVIAKHNAAAILANAQIHFLHSHWLTQFPSQLKADVIVSNPPYLAAEDPHLLDSEISHEPRSALISEDNGLADYKIIAKQAKAFLKPGGQIYFEHGADQAPAIANILRLESYHSIQNYCDLAQLPRITVAKFA